MYTTISTLEKHEIERTAKKHFQQIHSDYLMVFRIDVVHFRTNTENSFDLKQNIWLKFTKKQNIWLKFLKKTKSKQWFALAASTETKYTQKKSSTFHAERKIIQKDLFYWRFS